MKKFIALVMALVMALSLATVAWGEACAHPDACTHEAAIGTEHYATLEDAVAAADAAGAAGGGTVKLLASVVITTNTTIKADNAVTIDATGVHWAFDVSGGTLTLGKNITITTDDNVLSVGGAVGATAIIDGATITSSASSGAVVQAWNGGTLTIKSGSVSATGNANAGAVGYFGPNASTINVEGGLVTAVDHTAIVAHQYGTINVSGGAVTSTGSSAKAALIARSDDGEVNVSGGEVSGVLVWDGTGANASITGGTITGDVEAQVGTVTISGDAVVEGDVEASGTAAVAISGGTFSDDVSEYLAADKALVSDGAGGFVVVEESANSWNTLYGKTTGLGATIDAVTLEYYKAVAPIYNDDGIVTNQPSIAYYLCPELTGTTYLVEVTSLGAADVVVYNDVDGRSVFKYLDIVDNVEYLGNGVPFANFGKACGQYKDANYDKTAQYYTFQFGVFKAVETSPLALMVNGKVVPVEPATGAFVQHIASYTYNDQFEVTAVKCGVCGTPAVIVPNYASLPDAVKAVSGNNVINGTMYFYWPVAATGTVTDKVQSAETFDAGIAMYVGMSVMAATGSAVVIGKKRG